MSRKLMVALAIVIIAIVVIAGAGVILYGKDDRISLQAGYFLKYQIWNSGIGNYTITYDILDVNSSNISYEVTYDYYEWQQSDYSPNSTSYYNISNEVSIFPWDPHDSTNWKYLGKESIDTKWGELSTDHYSDSNGIYLSNDWIYHGISMKIEGIEDSRSHPGNWKIVLVDTNIPQLRELDTSLETGT